MILDDGLEFTTMVDVTSSHLELPEDSASDLTVPTSFPNSHLDQLRSV